MMFFKRKKSLAEECEEVSLVKAEEFLAELLPRIKKEAAKGLSTMDITKHKFATYHSFNVIANRHGFTIWHGSKTVEIAWKD